MRATFSQGRWLAVPAVLVFLLFLAYRVSLLTLAVPDIGGVENNVIWFVQQLLDGRPLYTDPQAPPFSIAQYGPLYYYLLAGWARLLGLEADAVPALFTLSRVVSLALNLAYAWVVVRACRQWLDTGRGPAWTAGLAAFIYLDITGFSRPDSLLLLLFAGALYTFLSGCRRLQTGKNALRPLLIAAGLCALGLFSKQSAFVWPVLLGGWLLWRRQLRLFVWFSGAYLAGVALLFLLFYGLTDFRFWYPNLVLGVSNGLSPFWFRTVIIEGFYERVGLLFVPLAAVLFLVLRRQPSPLLRFLAFGLLFLFLTSNGLAMKSGSTIGYFSEWWTVLFLGLAMATVLLRRELPQLPAFVVPAAVACALLLQLATLADPVYELAMGRHRQAKAGLAIERSVAQRVTALSGGQGQVLCNLYSPESFLNNLLFRQAVFPQFDLLVTGNVERVFDYSLLKTGLQNGRIRYLVTRTSLPLLQLMGTPAKGFVLADSSQHFLIYQYKP